MKHTEELRVDADVNAFIAELRETLTKHPEVTREEAGVHLSEIDELVPLHAGMFVGTRGLATVIRRMATKHGVAL